ncbi:MAG TPA: LLM class F420-dependent oxidoreductase [Acidimicrobiia bacterium]|nr:LLM class F420-dependent oxidoreductase [Acidimicrobiia bacterium]
MDLGRVGLWTFQLDPQPMSRAREIAQELESLGYGAIWLPESVGRDPFASAALLLQATERIAFATGIASIHARSPMTMRAGWHTLTEAFPDRFLLGLGVSHQPAVEGLHRQDYGKPLAKMRAHLDAIDQSIFFAREPSSTPRRVLAALGPKMLALAAERADGAHPYFVPPEHTALAREILGPDKLLAVEQMAVLVDDADQARELARATMRIYTNLPNYANNLRRLGFTDDDLTTISDRLVDAIVVWGDEDAVRARVQQHHEAGADHVCVQVLPTDGFTGLPLAEWRRLASALLA